MLSPLHYICDRFLHVYDSSPNYESMLFHCIKNVENKKNEKKAKNVKNAPKKFGKEHLMHKRLKKNISYM